MPDVTTLALSEYRRQLARRAAMERTARRLWRRLAPGAIWASWLPVRMELLATLTQQQELSVEDAGFYVATLLVAQSVDPEGPTVNPFSLAGIASDGRNLATLLDQSAKLALQALRAGRAEAEAMAAGEASLEMIVGTQLADAFRVATGVNVAARTQVAGYIRTLVGASCGRCVVLAGKFFRWNQGFQRHPLCDCIHQAIGEKPDLNRLARTPLEVFNEFTRAQQDRAFGKAGAEAIRDGADVAQVVNARRGMSVAGRRIRTTTEGTTRPDLAGRVRLMPEAIYDLASTREEAIRLLRQHGYI